MTVDELRRKHIENWLNSSKEDLFTNNTKTSIEFTISILEELNKIGKERFDDISWHNLLYMKIQELKTYLDEKDN